nr:hypothetical protein CTI12_AA123990 [Tanacetum cinerariifolium]
RGPYTFRIMVKVIIESVPYFQQKAFNQATNKQTSTKQYDALTISEVAALIINDFGDGIPLRGIIVKNNAGAHRILELHPSYMALQYPLLFPYGEDRFRENIAYHNKAGDAYATVEEQRLKWTRNNQDTLGVDLYHNLCDDVTRGDTSAISLRKRIVLPKNFIGIPRYMMQNYQDAMTLCQTYGNTYLFITFTSKPKWPEIVEMLAYIPGQ